MSQENEELDRLKAVNHALTVELINLSRERRETLHAWMTEAGRANKLQKELDQIRAMQPQN